MDANKDTATEGSENDQRGIRCGALRGKRR